MIKYLYLNNIIYLKTYYIIPLFLQIINNHQLFSFFLSVQNHLQPINLNYILKIVTFFLLDSSLDFLINSLYSSSVLI